MKKSRFSETQIVAILKQADAGWNKLKPDSDEVQAGAFKIDYGVLGVRYSFQQFRRMFLQTCV